LISCRHVDPHAAIASRIHSMVETFQVPRKIHVNGKRPRFRVFRDREELSASDLARSIEDALGDSRYRIAMCSQATPQSDWRVREAESFKNPHGAERIIPALVEGEPPDSFPPPIWVRPVLPLVRMAGNSRHPAKFRPRICAAAK